MITDIDSSSADLMPRPRVVLGCWIRGSVSAGLITLGMNGVGGGAGDVVDSLETSSPDRRTGESIPRASVSPACAVSSQRRFLTRTRSSSLRCSRATRTRDSHAGIGLALVRPGGAAASSSVGSKLSVDAMRSMTCRGVALPPSSAKARRIRSSNTRNGVNAIPVIMISTLNAHLSNQILLYAAPRSA